MTFNCRIVSFLQLGAVFIPNQAILLIMPLLTTLILQISRYSLYERIINLYIGCLPYIINYSPELNLFYSFLFIFLNTFLLIERHASKEVQGDAFERLYLRVAMMLVLVCNLFNLSPLDYQIYSQYILLFLIMFVFSTVVLSWRLNSLYFITLVVALFTIKIIHHFILDHNYEDSIKRLPIILFSYGIGNLLRQ